MKLILPLILIASATMSSDQAAADIDGSRSAQREACLTAVPIPLDFDKPVVVGEFHGTEQSAPVIMSLICGAMEAGRSVTLAVEMPPEAVADVYGPPVDDTFWDQRYPDGRASIATRNLLLGLRGLRLSGAVEVIGFEPSDRSEPHSRTEAAGGIMTRRRPEDTLIVLVGNYHARRKLDPTEDATLTSELGDVVNVKIANSLPGEAWACMPDCGVHRVGGSSGNLPLGLNPVSPANRFDFFWVVDRYTPSEPYRR
jgi:hypothetical protein